MPIQWSYIITPPAGSTETEALTSLEVLVPSDLAVDADGDLELPPRLVKGAYAVTQSMNTAFQMMLGEWFLDTREGIPYVEEVFVAAPDLRLIEALFRRAILRVPGIASLRAFAMSRDRSTRTLSIDDFEAVLVNGSTLRLAETPYVVYTSNG